MSEIKSIREADVTAKRVLMRCDFDVPIENGSVVDDTRLRDALPTLKFLREHGAAHIVLIGHVGRPGGKVVESVRIAPVTARLGELIDMRGIEVHENLRFDAREESNDESLAKELAQLGDVFVNEAFADSHREHASIVSIPKFLPSFMGLRFEEEVQKLSAALVPPAGAIAIIGGAKVETKAPLIEKFAALYSKVLVGGAIANGYTPQSPNVLLPVDGVRDATHVADIGPETRSAWAKEISQAPFVLWNGPMGMYEEAEFAVGTDKLAEALAAATCKAVVGGGDTEAAISKFSFDPSRIFISTGGGAMLEFLIQGTLPGIEALKK